MPVVGHFQEYLFNSFLLKVIEEIVREELEDKEPEVKVQAIYFHILSDLSRHFGILMMIYRRIISIFSKQLVIQCVGCRRLCILAQLFY